MMTYDDVLTELNADFQSSGQSASRFRPELIGELVHAIAACEKSPLVPAVVAGVARMNTDDHCLRNLARDIKDDLPALLRTSSAEQLSQLSAKLRACALLAQQVARLCSKVARVGELLTTFEHQLFDVAEHADEMAAESDVS